MSSIVITTPKVETANRLRDTIRRSDIWEEVIVSTRGSDTLGIVESQDINLVICTSRFGDMTCEEMISYLPSTVNVLLLTKNTAFLPVSDNVVRLLLPFKADDLISTIKMLIPSDYYIRRKKKRPERTPEEKELIDKAKLILMDRNDMSEPEAFRYIQKISMDTGRGMPESAQMIIMMN